MHTPQEQAATSTLKSMLSSYLAASRFPCFGTILSSTLNTPQKMDANVTARFRSLITTMGFSKTEKLGPYIEYIKAQAPGGTRLEPWLQLFIAVVEHFQTESTLIEPYIESLSAITSHFYFDSVLCLPSDINIRRAQISDIVFRMMGIWILMGSYFNPSTALFQHIERVSKSAGSQTVPGLVKLSGLLPHPGEADSMKASDGSISVKKGPLAVHSSLAAMESLSFDPAHLNAFRLSTFARTQIHWTSNISRHMLLSQHAGRFYLELFALPCTLEGRSEQALSKTGISSLLLYEIRDSYAALFNPHESSPFHQLVLRWLGASWWCPCLFCSSQRLLRRETKFLKGSHRLNQRLGESTVIMFDPLLEKYASQRAPLWTQTRFRNLWPRIVALDAHLREARPWGFWVLFRDRRDTLQFWTFLFGSLILLLTCIQVALGVAQVVRAF